MDPETLEKFGLRVQDEIRISKVKCIFFIPSIWISLFRNELKLKDENKNLRLENMKLKKYELEFGHLGAKIHILANTVPKNSFSWKSNIFGGFITWNLIFRHEKTQNLTIFAYTSTQCRMYIKKVLTS